MGFQSSDQRFEPESVQSRVLYDNETGEIVYAHQVVTMRGAAQTSDEDVDARIRELAAEFGIEAGGVELLRVDADEIDPGAQYRVDTTAGKLVRIGTAAGPDFGERTR
jgi:hypothetical protein